MKTFLFFRFQETTNSSIPMPLAKKWRVAMNDHATKLGLSVEVLPGKIQTKKDLDLFLECQSIQEWTYKIMSKDELIRLCQQNVKGFKQSMNRKPKATLVCFLMGTETLDLGQEKKEMTGASPLPESSPVPRKLKLLKKQQLVDLVRGHPDYHNSLDKKTKEVLINFILEKNISCEVPPTDTPTKKKQKSAGTSKTALMKLSKEELVQRARELEGYDVGLHGKTKKSLVDFLCNASKEKPVVPEKDKVLSGDEGGYSPVRISTLFETKKAVDPSALRASILKVLMSTEPFRQESGLEEKIKSVL